MSIDYTLFFSLAADWLINVSAGWFGAAVIVPAIGERPQQANELLVIVNLTGALASFALAYIINNVVA